MSLGSSLIPDRPSACLDRRDSSEKSGRCGVKYQHDTFSIVYSAWLHSTHTHTHTHTHICTYTHTHVSFYGLRGLSTGVMVFILYKLYVLLPYTYPTPKLSPHKETAFLHSPKKLTLYDS